MGPTPAAQPTGEASARATAVAFAAEGVRLAAGYENGAIRLWDTASGELRETFSGHVGSVRRLASAPDGSTLASLGEDDVVILWHLGTGQRTFNMDTQGQKLSGLAFSSDGRMLVAGARTEGKLSSSLLMWPAEPADR
jgi:WD40 repeat protein